MSAIRRSVSLFLCFVGRTSDRRTTSTLNSKHETTQNQPYSKLFAPLSEISLIWTNCTKLNVWPMHWFNKYMKHVSCVWHVQHYIPYGYRNWLKFGHITNLLCITMFYFNFLYKHFIFVFYHFNQLDGTWYILQ